MERGTEQNGEPGRQAGRDGRSDELMRTAREETNCHLTAIYSYRGALSNPSRFSSRPCVSSFVSSLAYLLAVSGSISSSHPVFRYRLVPRLVYPSRRASRAFPVPSSIVACLYRHRLPVLLFAHAVIGYCLPLRPPPLPPSLLAPYHDSG